MNNAAESERLRRRIEEIDAELDDMRRQDAVGSQDVEDVGDAATLLQERETREALTESLRRQRDRLTEQLSES